MPNPANLITLARIALAPAFAAALFLPAPWGGWLGFGLFFTAGMTDFVDGAVARWRNETSVLGKVLDPLADKLLLSAGFLVLALEGLLDGPHLFAAIFLLGREFLIAGVRETLAGRQTLASSTLAKWKNGVQLTAVGALIFHIAGGGATPLGYAPLWGGYALLWLAVGVSAFSGALYLRAARRALAA